jgi:hypothetical protein
LLEVYVVGKDEVPLPLRALPVLEPVPVNRRFAPALEVPLVSRRGNVQALARRELHPGSREVEFKAPLVLVAYPQDVVAVALDPGKGMALEAVDDLLLHLASETSALLAVEGQDAVGVPLLEVEGVNEPGRPLGVPPHHLGVDVPLLLEEVLDQAAPAHPASP